MSDFNIEMHQIQFLLTGAPLQTMLHNTRDAGLTEVDPRWFQRQVYCSHEW